MAVQELLAAVADHEHIRRVEREHVEAYQVFHAHVRGFEDFDDVQPDLPVLGLEADRHGAFRRDADDAGDMQGAGTRRHLDAMAVEGDGRGDRIGIVDLQHGSFSIRLDPTSDASHA